MTNQEADHSEKPDIKIGPGRPISDELQETVPVLDSSLPVFKPKHRIEIRLPAEEKVDFATVEHPFDNSEFLKFLQTEFPNLVERVKSSTRPRLSDKTNEMEIWESSRIVIRKRRKHESDISYLARLLYEECFSVNQDPDNQYPSTKNGVVGLTPGGLVSHLYYAGEVEGATIPDLLANISLDNSLLETVQRLKKEKAENVWKKARQLIWLVFYCTDHGSSYNFQTMTNAESIFRVVFEQNKPHKEIYDSVGFRLIKMFQVAPEMLANVEDVELKKRFGLKEDFHVSRAELFIMAGRKFSRKLLTDSGTFRNAADTNVKTAIEDLLFFRTHPELQVFFKYFSPSGFINEQINNQNLELKN